MPGPAVSSRQQASGGSGSPRKKTTRRHCCGQVTCHFNLLPRPDFIDEVAQQRHVLVARQTTCGDRARRLLQRDLLVVSVDGALGVDLETPFALALRAAVGSELALLVLNERAKGRHTGHAVKMGDLELGKHAAATRDYSADVDELVQVLVADVADVARPWGHRQLFHPNVDLLGDGAEGASNRQRAW